MTKYKKIFLDTTPVIYFLDADINYAEKVEQIFGQFIKNRYSLITSTITCTEYLTYPYRTGNTETVNVFFEFLSDCNIQIQPVDISIAKKRLRYAPNIRILKPWTVCSLPLPAFSNAVCLLPMINSCVSLMS